MDRLSENRPSVFQAIPCRKGQFVSIAEFASRWFAREPIPKYRRYHRPIVHLPGFCSDDSRRLNSIGMLKPGIGEGR